MWWHAPSDIGLWGLVWRHPLLSHEHSQVIRTIFISDVPQSTSSQSSHRCAHTLAPHCVRQVCPTLGGRCNSAEPGRFTVGVVSQAAMNIIYKVGPNGSKRCQEMGGVRPHFSQHIVYLRALLVRNRINKHDRHPARSQNDKSERGRHHTKGTRYVVNSLAALLGASAAIWSKAIERLLRNQVR